MYQKLIYHNMRMSLSWNKGMRTVTQFKEVVHTTVSYQLVLAFFSIPTWIRSKNCVSRFLFHSLQYLRKSHICRYNSLQAWYVYCTCLWQVLVLEILLNVPWNTTIFWWSLWSDLAKKNSWPQVDNKCWVPLSHIISVWFALSKCQVMVPVVTIYLIHNFMTQIIFGRILKPKYN